MQETKTQYISYLENGTIVFDGSTPKIRTNSSNYGFLICIKWLEILNPFKCTRHFMVGGKVNTSNLVEFKRLYLGLSLRWCILCKMKEESFDHICCIALYSKFLWAKLKRVWVWWHSLGNNHWRCISLLFIIFFSQLGTLSPPWFLGLNYMSFFKFVFPEES